MKISIFELPETITLNKQKLYLNGAAMRTKFFVNTYVIALYSAQPITTASEAIESTIPRSLRMLIATPLATPTLVSQNIESGVKESLGSNYSTLKATVDEIKQTIEASNIGYKDYIDNFLDKNGVLSYFKNDVFLGKNDKDAGLFAKALFDMYFGNKPKDAKIKKALLRGF